MTRQPATERLDAIVNGNDIVAVHEGHAAVPAMRLFEPRDRDPRPSRAPYETVDVLADQDIRQGIKEYSDWPTIPQLYVKGEFVGGSDIMMEMFESGELQAALVGEPEPSKRSATIKGAARGTRKPLRRPFDWFVEPSGRNQCCNPRAKCKKGRKIAENSFPLVPRARRIVKNSDTWRGSGRGPVARLCGRRVERAWRATIPSAPVLTQTTYCDLTQSWSAKGGGVGTYIRHKRRHILDARPASPCADHPGRARATWSRRMAARSR